MGVLKSPETPFRACVSRAFWRYHYLWTFSGGDTRAPGIKSNWCIYGFFNRLRATSAVVGSLATVPTGDRFLSPVPDGQGSYERGSRSTLVYRLELFQLKCIINLGTWTQQCPR